MSDAGAASAALPPLHGAVFLALTGLPNPRSEPRATCGDCVMCAGVQRSGTRVAFSPDSKCCTYIPNLPNFLTGRALAGPGRQSVLDRIGRRAAVTPLGLGLSQQDLRRLVGTQSHFGQDVVRCPHYVEESQGCAVWESRNAVCSTWFCQHERGATGVRFWHAVRDLLTAVEEQVAHRCLRGRGLPEAQAAAVTAHRAAMRETIARANAGEELPGSAADDTSGEWYSRMWGAWEGREEEWFAGCAASVGDLDSGQLASTLDGVRRLVDEVGRSWADLQEHEVPGRLLFTPGTGTESTTDLLRLIGYSPFDPLILPAGLEPSLWLLDGRPVADVLAEIERSGLAPLDDEVLARLHDFRVALAPPPDVIGLDEVADPGRVLDPAADAGRLLVLDEDRPLDVESPWLTSADITDR